MTPRTQRHAIVLTGVILILAGLLPAPALGQVTFERLVNAADEPHNWLTYSGTYASQRHSTLSQVTRANVADLELKWVFQSRRALNFQATPLVVDGIMYLTQPPNDVVALDARTGRVFWVYEHVPSRGGGSNRGLAIHGDTLLMGTVDAMLVAVDAKSGGPLWQVQVADPAVGYSIRHAPLVVKDTVIVGTSGGDHGARGLLAAYDVRTGDEIWRFYTIPAPGEPGSETWEPCTPDLPDCDPDAWMHGGGAVWLTGSYDPETNLTFWGVGNPGPNYSYYQRPGDNLYASSVVALDADTGELAWHFQFTPGDRYDYDALQIPVLVDLDIGGRTVKAMLWANRNGFFYILDRVTGRFLRGQAFSRVNWASGLDDSGRPIQTPQGPDAPTYPGKQGATNWYSPSYSPRTGLLYLSTWENYATIFDSAPVEYAPGQLYTGSRNRSLVKGVPEPPEVGRGHINTWTKEVGSGAVIAYHPLTGETVWKWETFDVINSGVLTTATDLVFVGSREGYFQALDAHTGEVLWRTITGGNTLAAPIAYEVNRQQLVAVASGHSLFVFGLRSPGTAAAGSSWSAPRTPWGHPDLQGTWSNATRTPIQRPTELEGQEFFTEEEWAERNHRPNPNEGGISATMPTGFYNDFWFEQGPLYRRTSLILEPPDGRLPPVTPAEQNRLVERIDSYVSAANADVSIDSWEDLSAYDRCITRGMPGLMTPFPYNHYYQILQTPDYVAIVVEMIHDARIIPLDGRPRLPPTMRQWLGDSRGRWEGNTLVVETTTFPEQVYGRAVIGADETVFGGDDHHVVERFTRVDDGTLDYRVTVTNPAVWTGPWTAAIPMHAVEDTLFEYGCHEGNYGLPNILSGNRAREAGRGW